MFLRKAALAFSAAAVLALPAGAAYASGGPAGGGGGGGGGVVAPGGGGVSAPAACLKVSAFSNRVGNYRSWAAIWTQLTFQSTCGPMTYRVAYAETATGTPGQVFSGTATSFNAILDNDFLQHSTTYTVTLTITDSQGVVQASQSLESTTPTRTPGA